MTNEAKTRGRPAAFANNFNVADSLAAIRDNSGEVSRYLALQLAERGLVAPEAVKSGGRGRPRIVYNLTGKGRGLVALSKNWKRA